MAWVPVGKVWAKVSRAPPWRTWAASASAVVTPARRRGSERLMAWPFWHRPMRMAMAVALPPMPRWMP